MVANETDQHSRFQWICSNDAITVEIGKIWEVEHEFSFQTFSAFDSVRVKVAARPLKRDHVINVPHVVQSIAYRKVRGGAER